MAKNNTDNNMYNDGKKNSPLYEVDRHSLRSSGAAAKHPKTKDSTNPSHIKVHDNVQQDSGDNNNFEQREVNTAPLSRGIWDSLNIPNPSTNYCVHPSGDSWPHTPDY